MWSLISIEATNLCAFEHFKYEIVQGQATLVFGNNMDNDSQNSNGSGKSALIEAIAIALTGETLRKVNMDEIINDRFDECVIMTQLANIGYGAKMTIVRTIPRKGTQTISVQMDTEGEVEEVKQATVLDYNKYILDTLGLTKDDIYSNYILTAKKYKSFLSSSDREKKELINRFSNGVLVDDGIEALHTDMQPLAESLTEATELVALNTGRVTAIAAEIQEATDKSHERAANRRERIEAWKQAIADKRAYIREQTSEIEQAKDDIGALNTVDAAVQALEDSDKDFTTICAELKVIFDDNQLKLRADYAASLKDWTDQAASYTAQIADWTDRKKEAQHNLEKAQEAIELAQRTFDADMAKLANEEDEVKARLQRLTVEARELQDKEGRLRQNHNIVVMDIADLKKKLAGAIVCPKCQHEFFYGDNNDVEASRKLLTQAQAKERQITNDLNVLDRQYEACVDNGKAARQQEAKLSDSRLSIKSALNSAERALAESDRNLKEIEAVIMTTNDSLQRIKSKIDTQRTDMFDDAYDAIDKELTRDEEDIKRFKLNISNAEGAISSYEESIKEAEQAAETDVVANLKVSKVRYEKELEQSIEAKEKIERSYNELKVQEATFTEFKTYLANIKIDAISEMTNDFLETIGSDIRVKLSGYTLLKSGKIRDKISVSLIRDGVDCGSFEKFSKGEQTRVELANILALHKLTNVNCEEGKGLNLLVFDEILDATDEQGLANVFQALNDTQITSLVVSHGNIAENYPNRLIINKQNGISFID